MRASEALGRTASFVERAVDVYEEPCARLGASTWTLNDPSTRGAFIDLFILQDPIVPLPS